MKFKLDQIEDLLIKQLDPTKLLIDDKTHLHTQHAQHTPGKIHLKIEIDSPLFLNKTKLEQHQLVMDILQPFLKDTVHSVTLKTQISEE